MKPVLVVLVATLAGCGVDVLDPGAAPVREAPPPLAIHGTAPGLVFTQADDEDDALDGIQTSVRVDVHDERVERVVLAARDQLLDDVVAEDLDGVPCARFVVTLASSGGSAETLVVASSPDRPVSAAATFVLADPAR